MRYFLRHKVVKKRKFVVVCSGGPHKDKDVTPENWLDLRGTPAKLLIKVPEEDEVMVEEEEDDDMGDNTADSSQQHVVDLDPREFLCESPVGSVPFDEGGCTTGRFMQNASKDWVHAQIEEFKTKRATTAPCQG